MYLRDMKYQAREIRECLINHDFDRIGEIMRDGWELKKKLASQISNPEIDKMYNRALEAGAIGGKISGAGGGGFLLIYCPREKQHQLRDALKDYREFPFFLEKDGSKIIFNMRKYK